MKKTFQELFEILDRPTRRKIGFLIFPMAISTILELCSLALVLPIIQLVILGDLNYGPAEVISEIFPSLEDDRVKYVFLALFGLFFVLKNLLLLSTIHLINRTILYTGAEYISRLLNVYLFRPMTYHYKQNSGELLVNLHTASFLTFESIKICLVMALDIMAILAISIFLIWVEPLVTLVMAIYLGLISVLYYKGIGSYLKFWGAQTLQLEGARNKWVLQSLDGVRDVKIANAYDFVTSYNTKLGQQYSKYYSYTVTAAHIPRLLVETLIVIGFLMVLFFLLGTGYSTSNVIIILGLFGMASMRLVPSLNRILSGAGDFRRNEPFVKIVHEAFSSADYLESQDLLSTDYPSFNFKKDLIFRNVSFSYPSEEVEVLNNINLAINKGEHVAIIGESGSGKTTLLDLMLGLTEAKNGKIEVDGLSIAVNARGWRDLIGFVAQRNFILDDSLRKNIAFGIDEGRINDLRVIQVLKIVGLKKLLDSLQDGLDTILGEDGSRLSGGQIQRVCIARSLYKDPEVLVYDEATSDLDEISQAELVECLSQLGPLKTIIRVTHNLGSLKYADRVFMIEGGMVREVTNLYQTTVNKL